MEKGIIIFTDMKLYDPNFGTNSLDIVAANNYYPFGMLMLSESPITRITGLHGLFRNISYF